MKIEPNSTRKKVRAATLSERFGFADPELSDSLHDAVMLWLDRSLVDTVCQLRYGDGGSKKQIWSASWVSGAKNRAWQAVQESIKLIDRDIAYYEERSGNGDSWTQERLAKLRETRERLASWSGMGEPPEWQPPRVLRKNWEYAVMNGSDRNPFVIGFIDLAATLSFCVTIHLAIEREMPLTTLPEWALGWEEKRYFFEVKTTMPSVGELLRQIQLYRQYINGQFVVVGPRTQWKDVLAEQGVLFIPYPSFLMGEGTDDDDASPSGDPRS